MNYFRIEVRVVTEADAPDPQRIIDAVLMASPNAARVDDLRIYKLDPVVQEFWDQPSPLNHFFKDKV